ncbi:hypothetical protein SDJN03_17014, partial [Cucurbita argyrosperma subsp. sororia]
MECNKEEAIKAMQIAEKKLEISDFLGARKMAQTAHRLFPTLENITQLLTVCEIHCSAQNRICGTENDWYGILQIEQSADETTIKKQYRKFALLLHPDKNKFTGAEAAFKLVGEANRLLSDQSKRKLYDMKCGAGRRNIAPKSSHDQSNGYAAMNKQESGTANGYSSVPFSHFPGRNSYKPPPPQQAFWTCCPFCIVRYQYLKCYLNKMLRCQNCGRGFISHDLNNQNMPPPSHQGHVPQKKVAPESGPSKSATQIKHGSDNKSQDRSAGVERASRENYTAGSDLNAKGGKKQKAHGDAKDGQGGSVKPKSAPKSGNRKRQRKSATTPVNNSEDDQDVDDDDLYEKDSSQGRGNCQRRSSRNKNHVSYQKYLSDDDDNLQIPKKSRGSESADIKEKTKDATADVAASKVDKSSVGNGTVDGHKKGIKHEVPSQHPEVLLKMKPKCEELKVMEEGKNMSDQNDKKSKVEDIDTENKDVKVHVLVCADPEFSNFDNDKTEDCFAVNQVWAIYDTIDGMPRFYARIRKVFSPVFKLQITWFEPNPDSKYEIDWSDAELPIACGKYTLGDTEETADLPMFSHMVHCPKQSVRNTYLLYPRKGETWALFKDWDIRWSSEPEKHVAFEYEFVEILSDYVKDVGISVAYMDKIKGFVCLFQTTEKHRLNSFKIAPNELYRFSHQVPSVRMTGREREGIPKGSFELDPAALPPNINDHVDLTNIKKETDNAAAPGIIDSSHDCESPEAEVEEIGIENNEAANVQKKCNSEKSNLKSEAPTIARKSPRKLNTTENGAQVDIDRHMPEVNGSKVASQNDQSAHNKSSVFQINGGTHSPKKHVKIGIERETVILRRSPRFG